jgi:trimeric autotransporter adhesin
VVSERPDGARQDEPLVFTLSTVGGLRPSVAKDALTVHFRDQRGAPVLNYSGLKVWDADGTILESRFERATDGKFRIAVEEAGARYPITIDPIAQQAYLKASNTGAYDRFGYSFATSGDRAVVGANQEDSAATGVNGTCFLRRHETGNTHFKDREIKSTGRLLR